MPDPINPNGQPLLDQLSLDQQFGGYIPNSDFTPLPNVPFKGLESPMPDIESGPKVEMSSLQALENHIFSQPDTSGKLKGGSISRSLAESTSPRFDNYIPGDYNNEDAYGQTQGFGSKMVSGVGKGLLLTGTTFLQSTVGLVNGVGAMINTGRAASFYDNDFTRELDEINKKAEDLLPNYYTDKEKNADWYSPSKLLTGNFLWDGIVKNLGFAAGAALSGGVYASGLKAIPLASRLFSVGKAAEALAATEEGIATATSAAGSFGKLKSLSDKFISSYNVLNPAGRAVVAGLSTVGEASFEAYQNLNDFRSTKIQEYKDLNGGVDPIGEELDAINRMADDVGNASFALNTALLSATNYIQFPKILGSSYTIEKGMINGLSKETKEIVKEGGEYIAKEGTNKILNTVNKVRPYLFSTAESFEEGAQYAISKGTEDYYDKKYKGDPTSFVNSLFEGVKETVGSNEGMISIITGGLSGAIMTGKGRFSEQGEIQRNTLDAVQSFNKFQLSDFTKSSYDSINRGVAIQEEREQLLKEGKISESKDAETDYMINYLTPRIKYGRFDLVNSDIDEYRKLASTSEGFSQLKSEGKVLEEDTQQSYLARLSGMERTAENVKSLYQSLNMRYGNLVDDKGSPVYSSEIMDKMVYSATKVADYDKRIPQVSADLVGVVNDIDAIINGAIAGDFEALNKGFQEIENLNVIEDKKLDLSEKLGDISRMAIKRDQFLKEYSQIKNNPKDFKSEEITITKEPTKIETKDTIKIKTKTGERDIEIGTEYVLGKVVGYSKEGKEVYRQPRLTVLGQNEDGTIKVKTSGGIIKDVSPEKLESYSLTPASSMLTNKKFAFFEKHQNSIFTHRGIKDKAGNPVRGRLQYNNKEGKLTFAYKDKNGKLKTREVWNNMFVAQKGFKQAILEQVGTITEDQSKALGEFLKEEDQTITNKNEERFEILANLSEDVIKRSEEVNKLIEQKTKQVENIQKDLDKLSEDIAKVEIDKRHTKTVKFRKATSQSLELAMKLSKMKEQLQEEIIKLEDENEELEYTKQYIENFIGTLEELPTSGKDLLFQLRYERLVLGDAIIANNKAISHITRLISSIEKTIDSSVKMLRGFLEVFGNKYPNVPSPNGQPWVDFLKENPNFLKNKPNYKEEYKDLEEYLSYVEDAEITPSENKIKDLKEHVDIISEELKELEKELKAHDVIHDKFKQIAKEYKESKKQEEIQKFNETLKDELIGVNDESVQNVIETGDYEPATKKDDISIVSSTIVPDSNKEHHLRANRFGNRFETLDNKKSIKGMIITSKTEDLLLPGLTNKLSTDPTTGEKIGGVNTNTIISLVFGRETPSGFILVDEFGEDIDDLDVDKLNKAVYQVFPLEELEANYQDGKGKQSMFRESSSPKEVSELKEYYKGWRDSQLSQTTLGQSQEVKPSMGILQYVTYTNTEGKEKRDYNARIPVEESGLISDEALETTPVVQVGINNTISNGSSTFTNAVGRVFLRMVNGLTPLNNRKFNDKEVNLIFDVILQASKNAIKDGNLKSNDTQRLFKWLRSVAYWGTAKNQDGTRKEKPGYNNIWFDAVTDETGKSSTKLFISGKGYNIDFTPSALERDKDIIKQLLSELYFNTNASLVNDQANPQNGNSRWNTPYFEIIGLDKEGIPITRKWRNYQSFLLSPLQPNEDSNGKPVDKRNSDDLPLTTNVRPLLGSDDINKEGIYFTLTNTVDDINTPKETPKEEIVEEKTETPIAKKPVVTSTGGIVMDGKTKNTITLAGDNFNYTINSENIGEITDSNIWKAVEFELPDSVLLELVAQAINKATGKNLIFTDPAHGKIILASIQTKLIPTIKQELINQSMPEEDPIIDPEPSITEDPTPEQKIAQKEQEENNDIDDEWDSFDAIAPDTEVYRVAVDNEISFEPTIEKWDKVEDFIKKSLPNIPFYRVKNIIQATNGRQAWGMLQEGAIYVYEQAEVGTAYHEVFEAVWKMFASNDERQSILKEFRDREGEFIDRETGRTIPYNKATNHQIKEQLAEEFRDHVLIGNATPKSGIRKLFDDIINFIKEFFIGKNAEYNTKQLFDRIGNGYYTKYNPYETRLSYANSGIIDIEEIEAGPIAEYRIEGIPIAQQNEILQHMTFATLRDSIKDNRGLFNVVPENKKELYERLQKEVLGLIKWKATEYTTQKNDKKITKEVADKEISNLKNLFSNITKSWEELVLKHENHLKAFDISFDENDDINVTNDEKRKDDTYSDARKIDSFRKASGAVKIMLGTLPETILVDGVPISKLSSIGGNVLVPGDRVFITLMNQLHDSINIDDMLNRLRGIALNDLNYQAVYKRLTKTIALGDPEIFQSIDYTILEEHDLQLIASFWKTMKKQNADSVTVFILPNSEIVVSDSTLTSAAKQSKRDMLNSITDTIKSDKSPFFSYNGGKYNPTNTAINYNLDPKKLETYTNFLKNIGIEFLMSDLKKLNEDQLRIFKDSIEGIKRSFASTKDLVTLNTQTLGIDGRLFNLGTVKAFIDNPEFESTYFNINGDKTQTYLGTNIVSSFYDTISKLKNLGELNTNPFYSQYSYLNTDVFVKGSQVLKKMFTDKGTRITGSNNLFRPVYIDGTINEETGKKKESSKLTYKERIVQEINLNLNGIFLNLVPGDASIEWGVKMYDKDNPFVSGESLENKDYTSIFKEYFLAEVELSKNNRKVAKNKNSKDLRFFKDILSPQTYAKIMKEVTEEITAEEIYSKNKTDIDKNVGEFIADDAINTVNMLKQYNILNYNEEGKLALENIDLPQFESEKDMMDTMRMLSINYIISNIEMHKLIYSDPFQYADELKRIKNFNSPRQPLIAGSTLINASMNKVYNKGYRDTDIAYTDMNRDHFRTITLSDVFSVNDNLGYDKPYEETDGGGMISLKALRVFKLRSGDWTEANENQFRYDIAYEKNIKGLDMSNTEKEIYTKGNPGVKDTYTPLKPIVAGNKQNGRDYNDIVLHKFALVPLSFRILHEMNPDSNAIKLYNKMQKEDVDYAVYASGSKVGTEAISPLYNEDGSFNESSFETSEQANNPNLLQGISKMPFAIVSVQSEVPSKDTPLVRQGTQITKLATMDFMEAGVPVDFEKELPFEERFIKWNEASIEEKLKSSLYKEIVNNQNLLEAKIVEGYNVLIKKLGISEIEGGYILSDTDKLVKTLKEEVLKREINENIISALTDLNNGSVIIEATPVYQQIRNILFSIADKNVVSPKISGGMKVQIPSALLESNRVESKIINGKQVHTSDILSFYKNEEGKRVCEVMVGRWFDSNMTDKQLLDYLNNTPEGQKILGGVGFRIPTQKQNSIDVFKIKQFLPKDFGDSVVIPSALVKKAGSDFDIDKLSIYLKNVFKNFEGNPIAVPYYGIGEKAKKEFSDRFDKGEFLSKKQYIDLQEELKLFREGKSEGKLIETIFADLFKEEEPLSEQDILDEIIENLIEKGIKQTLVDSLYMKSLENEYIESLENLISSPENYDNLVKPNDASQLQNLAKKINEKLGKPEIDYSNPGNMLSRSFMSSLRQAFVSGKYAIGIAAVGQTGHAQRQRAAIYIDTERMDRVPEDDKLILGNNPQSLIYARDTNINFKEYNKAVIDGKERPILAMIKNKAGEYISDLNGMFIDGYVDISKGPWIMELGATPNVTSTWLYLIDLGVPINTIAYFMNQPIVRDYLSNIENAGYSWLFIDTIIEDTFIKYNTNLSPDVIKGIPSESKLFESVGKDRKDMTDIETAEQQYILKEFLKYAKMASHVFLVTQGSNFDTATLNDPYLIFKKQMQYEKGKNTIISSIDNLANSSFINVLRNTIFDVRDAMSTILLSDRNNSTNGRISVRNIMEQVLEPFTNMNDRDFVKVSQKAVADLFDWAMQTNIKYNTVIASSLLGSETQDSYAKQIIEFRDKVLKDKRHPLYSNIIIQSLRLESGSKEGKVDNLSITAKDGKAFNQDTIIGGFRELKEYLESNESNLYNKLVRVALLQSGLTNSPISFSNLLPYEDFKKIYNETLSELERLPGLEKYLELSVFQRNNWSNSDVVAQHKATIIKSKKSDKYFNINEAFVDKRLIKSTAIPKVINISVGSVSGRNDFITYSWTDETIKKADRERMRKAGDFSYVNKMLMQKVYTGEVDEYGNRIPLLQHSNYKGKDYYSYIYKGINAWGDSFRAKEFYNDNRSSVLDNNYIKVFNEVEDVIINNIMNNIENIQEVNEFSDNKNQPTGLPAIDKSPKKC